MATVNELLTELTGVKNDIKNALIDKGVDMTGVPFTEYAEKVSGTYVYNKGIWNSSIVKQQSGTVTFNTSDIKLDVNSKLLVQGLPQGAKVFFEVKCTQRSQNVDDVNYGIHIMTSASTNLDDSILNRLTPIYYQDEHINKNMIFGIDLLGPNVRLQTGPNQIAYISRIWYE